MLKVLHARRRGHGTRKSAALCRPANSATVGAHNRRADVVADVPGHDDLGGDRISKQDHRRDDQRELQQPQSDPPRFRRDLRLQGSYSGLSIVPGFAFICTKHRDASPCRDIHENPLRRGCRPENRLDRGVKGIAFIHTVISIRVKVWVSVEETCDHWRPFAKSIPTGAFGQDDRVDLHQCSPCPPDEPRPFRSHRSSPACRYPTRSSLPGNAERFLVSVLGSS